MFDSEEDDFFDGDLNEDIVRFEAFLQGGQMGFVDSDRLEHLIDHYLVNSHYTKANQAADFAINQFPYQTTFVVRKAQALSALGNLKEGLSLLTSVEKFEYASPELILTKASIFSQLRDHKTAIKYFKEALKLVDESEDRDEIYLDLSMEYQAIQDYKGAINILKEAIRINPKNEGAIYEIAYCYDQLGEFDQSIQCYRDYLNEYPYSYTAWYNLGNVYSKVEDYDHAIEAYDYCIAITEEFPPAFFNLGNAYMGKDEFENARDMFLKCIDFEPEDSLALCYLGECYEQLNDLELAEKYYRKSVDIAPFLADAWLGLGIILDLKGNTVEAITLIQKATELDPLNAEFFNVLGGAFEKLDKVEEALGSYEKSLGLDASDENCLRGYVQLLQKIEPLNDTLAFLDEYEEELGKNDSVRLLKVVVLWKLGRKDEALILFKKCIELDKEHAAELLEIEPSLKSESVFIYLLD